MWKTRVFILLCCVLLLVESKRFDTRCKLVREFLKVGISNDHLLGQWVCLAEKVSNRDTSALTTKGGKKYYGIYQIPSQWCKSGRPGGDCNVKCEGGDEKHKVGLIGVPWERPMFRSGRTWADDDIYYIALLDDDIRDDTACAVTIFQREGFKYWKLWETRCKNDYLITAEIYKCPELMSPRSSPERVTSDMLRYRRMLMYKSLARAKYAPAVDTSAPRSYYRVY